MDNICANILKYCQLNSEGYCSCYMDYIIWSKDNPKLDFEQWKIINKIEYERAIKDNEI